MKTKPLWFLGIVLSLFTSLSVLSAADKHEIVLTVDTPWVIEEEQPEPLERALKDVQRDWFKVLGFRPLIVEEIPEHWVGPVIRFGISGEGSPESFSLKVDGRTLKVTGVDVRGAIYAAYTFSEEILGVDPWYFWTDHEPDVQTAIEVPSDVNMEFGDPTFRYRGWFINDEDLLNRFSPDPLQENPFSLAMLDRILETLLRLRGNMIIPGTFNFPDERAWELATRRGLALHMHHILVVGLNTFRWPDDVPFSYLEHPEIMEDYWRACIQQFKGKEVVWTVGYRGKGDQAFWTDEPDVNTPEARGGVISDAIARQVELIREVDPEGMIVTNLWKEGVQLMRDGHLEIPEEVVGVWPDNGFGLVRDGGTVEKGQGVYYHTAMLNGGANQLTEMVAPSRIYRELGRFVRAEATEFYLLNLSDVRPVPLSSDCTMRFVWNAEPYLARSDDENMDLFLADWSHRQFEEDVADEVAAIYKRYFNLPHMDGDTWDTCRGDNHMHWKLRFISRRASEERAMKEARDAEQFVKEYEPHVVKLLEDAEALAPRISEKRASFYLAHVLTQIRIHLYSMRILGNYAAAKLYDDVEKAELALKGYDDLRAAMRPAETDKWAAWYFGECLVGIEANRGIVRKLVAELKGEPIPTVRKFEVFPFIYQYQERFSDNFPFLYEQSKINAERE